MIYLDCAATSSIKPQSVVEAVTLALKNGYGNCNRGVNNASLKSSHLVQNTRKLIADFFGFPSAACIAFTANSTQALNIAINGVLKPNYTIVTTEAEHNSVLRPLFFQKNIDANKINLKIVPLTQNGLIDYEVLLNTLLEDADVLVITLASNVTGNLTDLYKIAEILEKVKNVKGKTPIFIADASQVAGSFDIDVSNFCKEAKQKYQIDILCCTGHKSLYGPQGTGFIGVMPNIKIKPFLLGGTGFDSFNKEQPEKMPTLLEAGTLNTHGIAGLEQGIKFIQKVSIKKIRNHENHLVELFYDGIKKINFEHKKECIKVYGDFTFDTFNKEKKLKERAPIISLNILDADSAEISDILSFEHDIATRAGAHCAPLVHKHFKTEKQGMVRFSFNYFTTENDIKDALKALEIIINELE